MDTQQERVITTVPGATYSVAILTPPVIVYAEKHNGERLKLQEMREEKAYKFEALTYTTVFCGGSIGHLTRVSAHDRGAVNTDDLHVLPQAETIYPAEEQRTLQLSMEHATWHDVSPETEEICLTPAENTTCAYAMQLLLSPANTLPPKWLMAQGADIIWPYGEATLVSGFSYVVTLVQFTHQGHVKISANITPLGAI